MKKIFKVLIFLFVFSLLLTGCSFFKDIKFSELKTGEIFRMSRDGYYEKLQNNYCINVDLGSKASLFKVPDEYVNIECGEWDSSLGYDNIIIEGHFIKEFYTSEYLVLCEEKEDDSLEYVMFNFANEQIQHFSDLDKILKLINIDSIEWSTLCNTNDDIRRIKR